MTRLVDPFTLYPDTGPPPGDSTLNTGIEFHFSFTGAAGHISDSVVNQSMNNVNSVQSVTGLIGEGAWSQAGSNGYYLAQPPASTVLEMRGPFTWAGWIYCPWPGPGSSAYNQMGIISVTDSGFAADRFIWQTRANVTGPWQSFKTLLGNGTSVEIQASGVYCPVNEWVHVAMGWDGTEIYLYQNDQQLARQAHADIAADIADAQFLLCGKGGRFFPGYVDEFALWQDRSLSIAEMQEHRQQGLAGNSYRWPTL